MDIEEDTIDEEEVCRVKFTSFCILFL
jgi:hypothetical protein